MRLFILISLSFLGITRCSSCVYQVRTRTVQAGGSVTILCSYSVPEKQGEDVQIVWEETDGEFCSSNRKIFTPSGNVTEKYKGRLYREKDPNRNWTEYIKITGLEPTDGPRFCCQLYDSKHNSPISWNTYGTLLRFPEYVTQLDEVMAVSGEEVTIPCYYTKDTSTLRYVSWNTVDSADNECPYSHPILVLNQARQQSRYSLVNFTQDISLRIHHIDINDHRSYCCVVSTALTTLTSKQFTRLIVADYQASWDQPTKEISVQENHSVILTCSYTLPSGRYTERDVLRVNVYWRVGNITGPYAYHPYQEMVHSTYRHRTSITGMTNLMIMNVTKADNTSFHCFVVVKRCAGKYQYEHEIMYGGGTRLIINDTSTIETQRTNNGNGSDEKKNLTFHDLMIIIVVSSVTLLVTLIVIFIILKIKGVICKKKKHVSEQQMNTILAADVTGEEAPYCEISTKKPEEMSVNGTDEAASNEMENGEDGNLLYAKLNKTKLKEKRRAENPKQDEEVVYAAVVKTTSE
ncbi:uncharacterized protein [Aquarana catesbeiana]|uniref:uncharacterized protein isoform X2 n=1 Tax=Aquarana catesbeiana TaxID=8400 RepID=UPI003CC9EBE6